MALLLVVAFASAIVSKLLSVRKNHAPAIVNGIRAKRITYIATSATVVTLLLSFIAMPVGKLLINGELYEDELWMRVANMCVVSCMVLFAASILSICYGFFQNRRNGNREDVLAMITRRKRKGFSIRKA